MDDAEQFVWRPGPEYLGGSPLRRVMVRMGVRRQRPDEVAGEPRGCGRPTSGWSPSFRTRAPASSCAGWSARPTSASHDIDHHHGDGVTAFFTPKAQLTFDRRTMTGHAEIAAAYAEIAADRGRLARHVSTNLHLEQIGDRVRATSLLEYYSAPGPAPAVVTGPVMVGEVVDVWTRGSGVGWLLAERTITFLFVAPDASFPVDTAWRTSSTHSPGSIDSGQPLTRNHTTYMIH